MQCTYSPSLPGPRLSFSQAEATILDDIDADGGQRKAALRLLKFVSMTRWTPEYGNILTSYHLKVNLLMKLSIGCWGR